MLGTGPGDPGTAPGDLPGTPGPVPGTPGPVPGSRDRALTFGDTAEHLLRYPEWPELFQEIPSMGFAQYDSPSSGPE